MKVKMFLYYLKKKSFLLLMYIFFVIIFYMAIKLENIKFSNFFYYVILIFYFNFIVFIVGYIKFLRKTKSIRRAIFFYPYNFQNLPKPSELYEKEYIDALCKINDYYFEDKVRRIRWREELLDYYANWIHQIKTPISVMNLIMENQEDENSKILRSELFKIENYSEMALNYLKLDEDTSDFVIKEYDLDDIARSVVRKYGPLIRLKNLRLVYEGRTEKVVIDGKWLSLLMEQILSNSIKYTEIGTISIKIKKNKIVVEDTGIGIAKEDIPRIFEKGYTGFNGRINSKSTGLGLYFAKKISDKIGCIIKVESEISKGTKVEIFIEDRVKIYE